MKSITILSKLQNVALKIWDGFLQNLGALLAAAFVVVIPLLLVSAVTKIRDAVRAVPSEWFLFPLIILIVAFAFVLYVNRKQEEQLTKLTAQEPTPSVVDPGRLVTHYGVWWKLFESSNHMEDFPYCPCCSPPNKLVQTDWHPHEQFKCPKTGTTVYIADGYPVPRREALARLSTTYLHDRGRRFANELHQEASRLKDLDATLSDAELVGRLLEVSPLRYLSAKQRESLKARFETVEGLADFIRKHYRRYQPEISRRHKERPALEPGETDQDDDRELTQD